MIKRRQILIASIGTSPGVLTNAVWALAHQTVPVIPDEVVVLMTKDGKESLRRALFEEGVWDEMLSDMRREKLDTDGKLVFGEASIRMIPDFHGTPWTRHRRFTRPSTRSTSGTAKARYSPLGTRLRSAWLARIASPACAAVTPRVWKTARGR